MEDFLRALPKAELHVHIEGTLEPELMLDLARRNAVALRWGSVEEMRASYQFTDLGSFLDAYYKGVRVLLHERDFYDLGLAYLERAGRDNVRRAEIFFDPQSHTARGVPLSAVVGGLGRAVGDAEKALGISAGLILCFLRHLSVEDAMSTLDQALEYKGMLLGVGLDGAERGNPPRRFEAVFARAQAEGLRLVAHAGEEGPPAYISEALDVLNVERIDHGVRCLEDEDLVQRLRDQRVPLTVCPLSNVKLRLFDTMEHHPLKQLMDRGLCVSVHSDDPAYFGGYITDNLSAAQQALGLDAGELRTLARNGFEASFLDTDSKERFIQMVDGVAPPEVRPGGQETL